MLNQMLHVFRNTPFGRETLLQSAYFCQQHTGLSLAVYVPMHPRFNLRFGTTEVIVFLDQSYLFSPDTARAHAAEVLDGTGVKYEFVTPAVCAARDLPELPPDFQFMGCPRVVSAQSGRIGLGHIGPKVRSIVKHAPFPVLIPSMTCKRWKSVAAFFGGSPLGANAIKLALSVADQARVPCTVFTQLHGTTRAECEKSLADAGLADRVGGPDVHWTQFEHGTLEENLWAVPHDALVVIGAAGHRLIQELVFGSNLEKVQSTLPNPLLVMGPQWKPAV
ncbi:MAG: universal stress protein [Phycisphaerae bacterium]|jgi:nucleotide-binding universal stress UspA family protein